VTTSPAVAGCGNPTQALNPQDQNIVIDNNGTTWRVMEAEHEKQSGTVANHPHDFLAFKQQNGKFSESAGAP